MASPSGCTSWCWQGTLRWASRASSCDFVRASLPTTSTQPSVSRGPSATATWGCIALSHPATNPPPRRHLHTSDRCSVPVPNPRRSGVTPGDLRHHEGNALTPPPGYRGPWRHGNTCLRYTGRPYHVIISHLALVACFTY